jgi:hypothetical protein
MNKKNYLTKLRNLAVAASLLVSSAIPQAEAREGFGIGAIVGEPTGVSIKYWLDNTNAIDAAMAVSLYDNNPFQFHADYLIHSSSSTVNSTEVKGTLPWYYGIGGRIKTLNNDTHFGVRVPLGFTYLVAEMPVDLFAEIAPVLDVTPSVDLNLNGAVGVRYYF